MAKKIESANEAAAAITRLNSEKRKRLIAGLRQLYPNKSASEISHMLDNFVVQNG